MNEFISGILIVMKTMILLPWIFVSTLPLWGLLVIIVAAIVYVTKKIFLKKSKIQPKDNPLKIKQKRALTKIAENYFWARHLYDGFNLHIDKQKNGQIVLFARFVTKGIHWGFKIKGHDYQDLTTRFHGKLERINLHVENKQYPFNELIKQQKLINKSGLFAHHHSPSQDIIGGNRAIIAR